MTGLLGVLLLGSLGCEPIEHTQADSTLAEGVPAVAHPLLERDLTEIRERGVIRMITRYNSSSYFIHKGGEAGFEYELFWRYARQLDLPVEVVIPEPGEDLISLLNAGRGDVICAGLARDASTDRYAAATRPYNLVHQVLVLNESDPRPATLASLAGLRITLPASSTIKAELQQIREDNGLRFVIDTGRPLVEPEELIAQVSRGEIQATVVDDNIARAVKTYLPNIHIGAQIGEQRPIVWMVRENSSELKASLNDYLKQHFRVTAHGTRRSQTYGILYERYYRDARTIKGFQNVADRPDMSGRISKYDDLIQTMAGRVGLDWRLVSALVYQESRFYEHARSSADARGLMQVVPKFAGAQADSLYYPAANLRAGLRLLKQTHTGFAYLDSLDRWRFTLATYHAGAGHVADARRLAMDLGRNPNQWAGSVAHTLELLMQRRYYSRTRHGFYRGAETVNYVEEILNRYRMYQRLVPMNRASARPDTVLPGLPDLPADRRFDWGRASDIIVSPPPAR